MTRDTPRSKLKWVYLAFAILGTVAPMSVFASWVSENGLNMPLFIEQMFTGAVTTFVSTDLVISAFVVFIASLRGWRRGVKWAWTAVPATILIGVSLGLPLYLFLETLHAERSGQGEP